MHVFCHVYVCAAAFSSSASFHRIGPPPSCSGLRCWVLVRPAFSLPAPAPAPSAAVQQDDMRSSRCVQFPVSLFCCELAVFDLFFLSSQSFSTCLFSLSLSLSLPLPSPATPLDSPPGHSWRWWWWRTPRFTSAAELDEEGEENEVLDPTHVPLRPPGPVASRNLTRVWTNDDCQDLEHRRYVAHHPEPPNPHHTHFNPPHPAHFHPTQPQPATYTYTHTLCLRVFQRRVPQLGCNETL
jgi:hypothetical protein